MKGYLLDTNICVFLFRKQFDIEERLNAVGLKNCFISEVTIAELMYGAYKSNRIEENETLVRRFIERVKIVSFAESIMHYAKDKNTLRANGTPIDDFDVLIAASAKARNLVLVTDNIKHFKNVPNLSIENWVER